MKKIVLVCGLISGALVSGFMTVSMLMSKDQHGDLGTSMVIGFASMILAFSLIFVGVRNYRDKQSGGEISFGKALTIGLLISLIASTMYVITWMIVYYNWMPDFMDRYAEVALKEARQGGATEAQMHEKQVELDGYKEMYKNPLMIFLFTYVEILPVGIIMSLIAALVLRRRRNLESSPT